MPEAHMDSPDLQAANGPAADGGTPASAAVVEAQQVDGGGAPEAPATGTPDSTPAIPDVGSPTETPKEDSPPTTPVDETNYEQRWKDTKDDRDAKAAQINRLRDAGLIDAEGNVIEQAPAAAPAPTATVDDQEAAAEFWNSRYDAKVAELGPIGAHNWAVRQGLLPGGQAPAAAPVATAPQGATLDQVQSLIARNAQVDAQLDAMAGRYHREGDDTDFMAAMVNYGGQNIPRKTWLDIESRRTGASPEAILMANDSGSAVEQLAAIRTDAMLAERLREQAGNGGPSAMGPMIAEAPPSAEMDAHVEALGGRLSGPVPAPHI